MFHRKTILVVLLVLVSITTATVLATYGPLIVPRSTTTGSAGTGPPTSTSKTSWFNESVIIMVRGLNGFNKNVNLTVTTSLPTFYCSLSPSVIVGGNGNSTLICGSMNPLYVTVLAYVTGTCENLSHSVTVPFNMALVTAGGGGGRPPVLL